MVRSRSVSGIVDQPSALARVVRHEGYAAERSLLHRQTARKFRTATADQLATAIADLRDPERLAEIGESIIDCSTATELLERVRIICRRQAAEQQD